MYKLFYDADSGFKILDQVVETLSSLNASLHVGIANENAGGVNLAMD